MAAKPPILELGNTIAQTPFRIHTLEWLEKNRPQNNVPHRHNYFVILWVKRGTGTHQIDLDRFSIADNTVYCVSPGQVHLFQPGINTQGYVISFTSDFFCRTEDNHDLLFNTGLFYTFPASSIVTVSGTMHQEMDDMATRMVHEFENFFLLRGEVLRGFLKIFMIYLTRQYQRPAGNAAQLKSMELVKNFMSLLDKHFATRKMVADYAEELNVTPNYLNEIIKKASGTPASEHIRQRITLEAKRLAIYTDESMKEIAFRLGFEDAAHFSKFFKNTSGMNFTDFKKQAEDHLHR